MTTTAAATMPAKQATPLPEGVDIKVRHLKFQFPEKRYWLDNDPFATRFIESLSMFFPDGETFFVKSVLHYRDRITDPELKKQVAAFAGQEHIHSTEHQKYNARAAGRHQKQYEKVAGFLLNGPHSRLASPLDKLAVTTALEHFTAILADEFLKNPAYSSKMEPAHAKLWLWHAAEETEHKAVAFDVYKAVGGGYFRRAFFMLAATMFILLAAIGVTSVMLWRDRMLFRLKTFTSFLMWGFIRPGLFVRVLGNWFDYFKPGFHPWQHNNAHLLADWKKQYAEAA
ncbi:MAG: metal-dependent hydrolase [Deltaproteobacteria bacterium]|nr:metal-dependent hydrolase [Deltaproteobacteria bacterium]